MYFGVLCIVLFKIISSQDLNPFVDIKTLSELPLEKLIQVQNSFKIKEYVPVENNTIEEKNDNVYGPLALALQRKKESLINRGGHEEHYEYEEKSKVQSIFQLSVTALAFLSFGGYLLCLIVQAIRSKQQAESNATATQQQILAAIINSQANRRPIRIRNRRPNNNRRPNRYVQRNKNRRPVRHKRDVMIPDINPDNMYYALVTLSEAYTNYHTTNFRYFNETITRNGF